MSAEPVDVLIGALIIGALIGFVAGFWACAHITRDEETHPHD